MAKKGPLPLDASGASGWSRRRLLGAGVIGAASVLVPTFLWPRLSQAAPCAVPSEGGKLPWAKLPRAERDNITAMGARFDRWLREKGLCRDAGAVDMVWNFFNPGTARGNWVYPMLTGKAVLWFVSRGDVETAQRCAEALLRWQQVDDKGPAARSFGAFPSKLEVTTQGYVSGDYYYTGDALVIAEALALLFERTKNERYLNAAIGAATWVTSVMCQGHRYGVWAEDHGAPMAYVTKKGDFNNHIPLNGEMMWISALDRVGRASGENTYCDQAERARTFYRQGQLANGPYYDHYDPGYPPKAYARENWKTFQPGQVISDNQLRCALGACRMGDVQGARRFFKWLKSDGGAIPAYLSIATGRTGFPPEQKTYVDVSSTALHRSLAQWLGEADAVQIDTAFLQRCQSPDGGWHWGLQAADSSPVTPEQAPVVGFWATADLAPPVL